MKYVVQIESDVIHTKFRKIWYEHSAVNVGIDRQHGDLISLYLSISGFTTIVDLGPFFQFLNPYTVSKTPWADRKATTYTQNNTN
jgi:hypothetical protein